MLVLKCQNTIRYNRIINISNNIICRCISSSYNQVNNSKNSSSSNNISIDWANTTIDNIIDNKSIILDTIKDVYDFSLRSLRLANKTKQLSFGQSTICEEDDASLLVLCSLSLPLLGSTITKNNYILDDGIKKYGNRILTRDNKVVLIDRLKQRIVNKVPIAYLVEGCYQQGEYFYINNNCIIPRSFIGEILADDDISSLFDVKTIENVCDLCTGTGALAILATKYLPKVRKVHAIDICSKALQVCTTNVNNKNLNKIINIYQSDLFNNININNNNKYDLILCNPPYVDKKGMNKLPKEYSHEPVLSLAGGGNDGLEIIDRILHSITPYMKNDNSGLLLEIGRTKKSLEKRHKKFCESATWLTTELSEDEVMYITKKDIGLLN